MKCCRNPVKYKPSYKQSWSNESEIYSYKRWKKQKQEKQKNCRNKPEIRKKFQSIIKNRWMNKVKSKKIKKYFNFRWLNRWIKCRTIKDHNNSETTTKTVTSSTCSSSYISTTTAKNMYRKPLGIVQNLCLIIANHMLWRTYSQMKIAALSEHLVLRLRTLCSATMMQSKVCRSRTLR